MSAQMFDLDRTPPKVATNNIRCPEMECMRSSILLNKMLDEMLDQTLERFVQGLSD